MIGWSGVALQEVDDHLLADARDVDRAPLLARPERGHADPAGAVDVVLPSRSQWNCTFTRPYLSAKISSPAGPTTTAVCTPRTLGLGVTREGRYGSADGMQVNVLA